MDNDRWVTTVGCHPPGERAALFFDLDGTLIDSAVGITQCVAHALTQMGRPVPPQEELRRWIGPSLRTSFAPLFDDPEQVEQAVTYYRERFDVVGWREHDIYPRIGQVVQDCTRVATGWRSSLPRTSRMRGVLSSICRLARASRMSSAQRRTAAAAKSRSWWPKRCGG